jgi:acyl-CoA synthetase (AMP-forming)/AMP-acid ligase II
MAGYKTDIYPKRSNWVIAIVALLILGLVALPFVWAFTGVL